VSESSCKTLDVGVLTGEHTNVFSGTGQSLSGLTAQAVRAFQRLLNQGLVRTDLSTACCAKEEGARTF